MTHFLNILEHIIQCLPLQNYINSYYPSQIDVTGTAYFIGQTIDSVSCICMVLAIGFSVDYSVHIAHAFSVAEGDRDISQS